MASDDGDAELDSERDSDVELFDDSGAHESSTPLFLEESTELGDADQLLRVDCDHRDVENSLNAEMLASISHPPLLAELHSDKACSTDTFHDGPLNIVEHEASATSELKSTGEFSLHNQLGNTQELITHLQDELEEDSSDEFSPGETLDHGGLGDCEDHMTAEILQCQEFDVENVTRQDHQETKGKDEANFDCPQAEKEILICDRLDLESAVALERSEDMNDARMISSKVCDGAHASDTPASLPRAEAVNCQDSLATSPRDRDSIVSVNRPEPYSIATVFPTIFETQNDSAASKARNVAHNVLNRGTINHQSESKVSVTKHIAISAASCLQQRLQVKEQELLRVNKQFTLQVSLLENEKDRLAARNSRLQHQLKLVTSELQRMSCDVARLTTENQLLASKVPKLQAELDQESFQVDEGRSHSLQAQLVTSQLQARLQVLQTRNAALEAANARLTGNLRETKQEIRRKVGVIEQQALKLAEVHSCLHDLKIKHTDEVATYKQRLVQSNRQHHREYSSMTLDWERKRKNQAASSNHRLNAEVQVQCELEKQIRKISEEAHDLRSQLSSANKQVFDLTKALNEMKRYPKRLDHAKPAKSMESTPFKGSFEQEILSLRVPFHQTDATYPYRCGVGCCCNRPDIYTPAYEQRHASDRCDASTMTSGSPKEACQQCSLTSGEIRGLQLELSRVRELHAQELKAQSSAIDMILRSSRYVHTT